MPRVTVLMAVYNGERFLRQAIESILAQTFTDFELLIVDDGSTDRTPDIIRSYRDPRIRVMRHESNRGVAYTRSCALPLARGEYVAVLDADDVSYPHRLETQVAYLDAHPDIVLLGSSCEYINEQGGIIHTVHVRSTDPLSIRWRLLFGNCITHSTVMYRSLRVLELGGYNDSVFAGEDYDLYVRLAVNHRIAQLDEVLVQHREHPCSLEQVEPAEVKRHFVWTTSRSISNLVGFSVPYEVAECLRGCQQDVSPEVLRRAYALTWTCLRTLAKTEIMDKRDHRKLFCFYLEKLTQLIECYNMRRYQVFGSALRGGLSYAPAELFSLHFVHFLYRVGVPKRMRQQIKRVLFLQQL